MDEIQCEWLAGNGDYLWAERQRAAECQPEPPDEDGYAAAVKRAGVTELPDGVPPRDALLGDLGGGPSLDLLDRFSRTRHVEDDNPPGMGS